MAIQNIEARDRIIEAVNEAARRVLKVNSNQSGGLMVRMGTKYPEIGIYGTQTSIMMFSRGLYGFYSDGVLQHEGAAPDRIRDIFLTRDIKER